MITSTWSTWHIFAVVLTIGVVFLFYYLIMLLNQLRSTLRTVENTIAQLQNEVSPVINNVEGITGNVEQLTGRADDVLQTVQDKTVETMGIVDSLKNSLDILKHTLFLFLNQFSKYTKALGIGIKVGISHYRESATEESLLIARRLSMLPSDREIIDHLEYLEIKPK